MKTRLRFRIRGFLILVALLAVAIVAPSEYRNWVECSLLEHRGIWLFERVKSSDRERAVCLSMQGRGHYDYAARQEFLPDTLDSTSPGFNDWSDEAAWHLEQAKLWRSRSDAIAMKIQERRKRLVFPWFISRLRPSGPKSLDGPR